MKYLLIFLPIFSFAQSDSIECFPREAAIRVLTAAKQKVILDSIIIKLREDVENYEAALTWYRGVIAQQDKKDSAMQASFNREIATMQAIQFNYANQVRDLEKKYRKAVAGKKWMSVFAIIAVGAAGYFAVK